MDERRVQYVGDGLQAVPWWRQRCCTWRSMIEQPSKPTTPRPPDPIDKPPPDIKPVPPPDIPPPAPDIQPPTFPERGGESADII